jgi:hypothetical protein
MNESYVACNAAADFRAAIPALVRSSLTDALLGLR